MKDAAEGDLASSYVAVIGMAGRFPGAPDVHAFWANLRAGVESVRFFTEDELRAVGELEEALRDPAYVRACPLLADVELYDAGFFGHSRRDAAVMDPQHRVFLETAWAALENSGYVGEAYPGPVGVFAACGMNAYMMHHLVPNREVMATVGEWLVRHTGNDANFLATRVSYELDLDGPSMSVQAACSSALVAVHVAAQSLLTGECDLALAGASAISLPHDRGYLYREGEILSPDGHCRAFDARASGTIFGSGVGCVVLKRLADAVRDGDHVSAVLRGSAVNNDGASKVGYLAPSVDGQARVVVEALDVAGVAAESISYVETHGTGTRLGDPIEVAALAQAYAATTSKLGFCAIGSVKPNIGHLGEAAGVAGFIKAVLALSHAEIPPSLNYERPNTEIDFASTPFFVNTALRPWTTGGGPRRAGVTALGAGGTNVHAILEEAPRREPSGPSRAWKVLVLSAKTRSALDAAIVNLASHLERELQQDLADVAYTLQVGRKAFAHRHVVVCKDRKDAIATLSALDPARVTPGANAARPPAIVFMFPGGGAQYRGMGAELYATEPVYRKVIDACASAVEAALGLDLRTVLYPAASDANDARLDRPSLALPALFATSLATARLLLSWGVEPDAMIGHSAGEYVAACMAGVVSMEDGIRLVALRGRLFETLPAGAMLSVALGAEEARVHMDPQLSFAAINAPGVCVVSGPERAIVRLEQTLGERAIDCARVHIDVAAHSSMLEPILGEFERFCRTVHFAPPSRRYVSNVTGTWVTEAEAVDPMYWVRHLRSTVRFADGLACILEHHESALVEVGPGRTLSNLGRMQGKCTAASLSTLRHPSEAASDVAFLLGRLGRLWAAGVVVDWKGFHAGERRHRVELPTYPFERQRFWIDRGEAAASPHDGKRPLCRRANVADWFHLPSWRRSLAPPRRPVLALHPADAERPTYLVFADGLGLGAALAPRLPAEAVVTVIPGHGFARVGEYAYTVAPGRRADYDRLVAALSARGLLPQRVVHLWNVTSARAAWTTSGHRRWGRVDAFDEGQTLAYYSLLFLAQALAPHTGALELTIVSNDLQEVAGETGHDAEKATLLGPCLVIPREFPNVTTRAVDVVMGKRGSWQEERMLTQLVGELASPPKDQILAYRGADRWVQTLEAARLEPAETSWVRPGGVYLITGGLGGLGLELAAHIARAAPTKLVLIGRGALPHRSSWVSVLEGPDADGMTGRRIRAIRAIEALGSEVMAASADVTEPAQMEQLVADVKAKFGPIRGVIHAAGTLHDVLIELRPPDAVSEVIAVKAKGALVLDAVLRGTPLDFFVLFSSVSALLGLPGQVDYTAANAFLDAFARRVAARGETRAVSIDWSAWRDVGMAAALATSQSSPLPVVGGVGAHPLLERRAELPGAVLFSALVSRDKHWIVAEHVVRGGDALLPGTGYLELARAALAEALPPSSEPRSIEIRNVVFLAPFVVTRAGTSELRIKLSLASHEFVVFGATEAEPHATGTVRYVPASAARSIDLAAIEARCAIREDPEQGFLAQPFMDFGPRWGNLVRILRGRGEALLTLALPDVLARDLRHYQVHPALLDMATGGAQALLSDFDPARDFYVPFSYGRVLLRRALPARLHSHVRVRHGSAKDHAVFDVTLVDEAGDEVAEISELVMRRVADSRVVTRGPSRKFAPSSTVDRQADAAPNAWSGSLREAALREGIPTADGLSALDRILARCGVAQIIASSIDIDAWTASVASDARPRTAAEAGESGRPAAGRPDGATAYVAPRDAIEQELAGYWRELLGVEAPSVDDDFFELGGQSLIAVRLFNRIRKTYAVDLPLSTLFEAPTIARCASILHAELGTVPHHAKGGAVERVDASPLAPPRSRWSSLVVMQPRGARPPFYCVAGMGGNLANLRRLASLVGDDQPFYGLQPPGLDGKQKRLYRVEELAEHYIEEVLAFQPVGPFLLGGYSGGGVAAFEMSRQLMRAGHEVAFLGLLDSFSPALPRKSYAARAGIHVRRAQTGGPAYLFDLARRRLGYERRQAMRLMTRALGRVFPERYRYANIGDSWATAEAAYAPGVSSGKATLFRAAEETAISLSTAFDVDEQHGWGRYLRGEVQVELCPGNHTSMCEEPHVQVLAARLRASLERAAGAHAAM
jgi:acyl transferase domain-containing protein/thioesterase domain-containing protein